MFTLTEKGIEAVAWTEMLHDPFFSFLGAKRKVLPPTSERLGLDAGVEKDTKSQRNHYFAALWKLPRPAGQDASGYELLPQNGTLEAALYLGPKQAEPLLAFEKPFTQVIDYGFFGAVCPPALLDPEEGPRRGGQLGLVHRDLHLHHPRLVHVAFVRQDRPSPCSA